MTTFPFPTTCALAVPPKPKTSTEAAVRQDSLKKWKSHFDAANAARRKGDFKEAESEYRSALKESDSLGPQDRRSAESMKALGWLLYSSGRYAEAEEYFSKALERDQKILGAKTIEVVSTLNALGRVNRHLKRYDKAQKYQLKAIEIRASVPGDEEPDKITLLHNLARVYAASGKRQAEAEKIYVSAIKEEQAKLNDSISSLSTCQVNLGALYVKHKVYEEAAKCFMNALTTLRLLPTKERELQVADVCTNLASLYFVQKKYKPALTMYYMALDTYTKYQVANNQTIVTAVNNCILAMKAMNLDEDAAKLAEKYKVELSATPQDDPRIPPTNMRVSMLNILRDEYPKVLGDIDVEAAKDAKNWKLLIRTYQMYISDSVQADRCPPFIVEDRWRKIVRLWKAGNSGEALALAFRPDDDDECQIQIPK